jgi:hypothetical protein
MSPSPKKPLLALMDEWPDNWAGSAIDKPFGAGLVEEMRPFVVHLDSLRLTRRTVRNHLDNLWVIGGEIIRRLYDEPKLRKKKPRAVLLDAIDLGEAPLVCRASEEEQRGFDATAHKLLRFLTAEKSPALPTDFVGEPKYSASITQPEARCAPRLWVSSARKRGFWVGPPNARRQPAG